MSKPVVGAIVSIALVSVPIRAQEHPFVEVGLQVFAGTAPVYEQFDRIPAGAMLGGGSVADFDNDGLIDVYQPLTPRSKRTCRRPHIVS